MDTQVKVSIIIPVYNGAEFLRRSFDSALYQTLPEVEVIAVNDCSPDPRDAEIMCQYEKLYPGKFRALFHDTNMRQGGARNTGIKSAGGEYFLCVDQDDYIDLLMCEKMYNKAKADNADLVLCGYGIHYNGKVKHKVPNVEVENAKAPDRYKHLDCNAVWTLLVKTRFIINNELYFPYGTTSDDAITFLWYLAAEKIARVGETFYHWCYNPASASIASDYKHFLSHSEPFETFLNYPFWSKVSENDRKNLSYAVIKFFSKLFIFYVWNRQIEQAKLLDIWDHNKRVFKKLDLSKESETLISLISDKITSQDLSKELFQLLVFDDAGKRLNNRVTIFGCGVRGKRLAEYLESIKVPFEITDSDPEQYGMTICNKIVKPWNELKESTDLVIVSPFAALEDIKKIIHTSNIDVIDFDDLLGI